MRAVVCRTWTEYVNLSVETVDDPVPGPGRLLIRTQAAGVGFSANLFTTGRYQRRPPLPFTPGTEVGGVVAAVGPGVTRFGVGDRVIAALDWGGHAELAVANEVNSFALPDELEFCRSIYFTSSYGTSYCALVWPHLLRVQAGETLLIHGAAGAIGLAAIEIGKILGATVIAVVGGAEKAEAVRAHGADHVVDHRTTDFREVVLDLTGGRGANAIYDPVGGDVFDRSLRCIAPEGRIMPAGFAEGRIPQIPANILLVKNVTVCGLNYGYYLGWSPRDARASSEPRLREMMDRLFAWYAAGKLVPRVSELFPLDGFREAMRTVLDRRTIGRAALVFDAEARRLGISA